MIASPLKSTFKRPSYIIKWEGISWMRPSSGELVYCLICLKRKWSKRYQYLFW